MRMSMCGTRTRIGMLGTGAGAPLLLALALFGGDGFGGGGFGPLLLDLVVRPAHAYNPRAFGPSGAFRPSSGSSAQGGRGADRYGNTASDVVTGQGAAANPYEDARRREPQPQPKRTHTSNDDNSVNQPVISGERASMASRYSNSFSAFGDTVQQQASAVPLSLQPEQLDTAPRPETDDDDGDSLGAETTSTTNLSTSTIRIVTRRFGVQKPPGYVGKNTTKRTKKHTGKPKEANPITNQQTSISGKVDNRSPLAQRNQVAAATAAKPPTRPATSQSKSAPPNGVPRPVISGERASMASRYANSFSPYGSTAPAPEGPAQSTRARQLVGEMLTPPASPTAAAAAAAATTTTTSSRGGTSRPTARSGAGGGVADGMRPVISGDRASMDNRYSNSLSAFGDTAPAPPSIVQQQRAAKQSSTMTPRVGATPPPPPPPPIAPAVADASGGKTRVVRRSKAPPSPPPPPPQRRQPPKQQSAGENPNRPVISGDRGSLDNRYSNSFSPFTNAAASAKPVGGGGRKPTDGPFPSVVRPPPMPKADMAPLPATPMAGRASGRAEAKKRKPMIIPRADTPQIASTHDNALDDEIEEERVAEKSTPSSASLGGVTHNGDRAGNRNQNSFSAFGDTPVAPVIGGARTDDRYGNSFDSSGNVKPQTSASSSPSKARPIPPAAVMNDDRTGGRNQNSFSAFGDTPAPGAMSEKAKRDIDDATPPKEVSHRTTTTQSKPEKPVDKKPQVEPPKAVLGGARVEDIYGNSLSAFGDVDLTKMKPRRKPAARFASSKLQTDQTKKIGSDKAATSTDARKKEVPKAIMNGARADDIYFNSFSAFGADVTKTPKAPRQASRPAKRVPAAYTGNPDVTVSQDSGISGSSASNEHDRYGNAHHVYNSHVHALKHQEPIEDDEDGGIITKKERKWIIP